MPDRGEIEPALGKYRGIMLDCDDTILETAQLRWSLLIKTAAIFGVELKEEAIRAAWGMPFNQLIATIVPEVNLKEFVAKYSSEMRRNRPRPTKGAIKLLEYLRSRGAVVLIVTSSSRALILQDLRALGMASFFAEIYGFEQSPFHKPDPRVLQTPIHTLTGVGMDLSEMVYIGDSVRDYQAASGSLVDFIGVLTGLESRSDLIDAGVPPNCIVDDLTFLLPKDYG